MTSPTPQVVPTTAYQSEIYLAGLSGTTPALPTDLTRLEALAEQKLDSGPFWYVAGGAGTGATMRANRAAMDTWRIVPRMLREATQRRLATTVLGTELPAPVLLAPVGVQSIVHPDGELAVARAAAELGVPIVLSTASSYTIEEVAEASGAGPRWYQLYWPTEDEVTISLLGRARAAGYTTLVVTLDTWTLGYRPHDLDQSYLPFIRGVGTAIPFSDPAFRAKLAAAPEDDLMAAVGRWLPMFTGTALRWDRLPLLREHWDGPIVLKGVQHPEDARRAIEAGMDGIVVSNHGGRQVDGAVAALDTLPGIVAAVDGRAAVLFDSGVRTGADVFKALALGADAVLLARPYVYGLALAGQDGVRHVLRSLLTELDVTLGLAGYADVAELTPDALVYGRP
ncbi:MAG TPA: lactate 2-monooxygenase [Pseudonocardia sp.]|jgi:isopentenyl diphosphate isomerase/L-lactate dehydrogenase-like FMN-dependent dehydrogenase|uniref:lactate 2-monooxygenase n=1 Tax=Pseudonocardia sp. Cha107L01 TaxID=3457576 RepID=UPI0028CABD0F|nr:lactate 2-monooxygenase [Pseudonocardia sp.]MDT7565602.1 lactate 2-monooxygenase [Pseudonocardiales bacterium]MDT7665206.1 lactate 2-monooxygenase [Pseudonocardiales bacterium]MDT7683949.1 lactate 2-monooxygenase [Pseudonocardiales bacterium]MDT7750860.1 lactate 2-monooxygenase [Pseudonocardiales bacterium]